MASRRRSWSSSSIRWGMDRETNRYDEKSETGEKIKLYLSNAVGLWHCRSLFRPRNKGACPLVKVHLVNAVNFGIFEAVAHGASLYSQTQYIRNKPPSLHHPHTHSIFSSAAPARAVLRQFRCRRYRFFRARPQCSPLAPRSRCSPFAPKLAVRRASASTASPVACHF